MNTIQEAEFLYHHCQEMEQKAYRQVLELIADPAASRCSYLRAQEVYTMAMIARVHAHYVLMEAVYEQEENQQEPEQVTEAALNGTTSHPMIPAKGPTR
jgi:hypothetical protein